MLHQYLYLFENEDENARERKPRRVGKRYGTTLPRKIILDAVLAIVNWQLGGILNQDSSFTARLVDDGIIELIQ